MQASRRNLGMDVRQKHLGAVHARVDRRSLRRVFVRTVGGSHFLRLPIEDFLCHAARPNVLHDSTRWVILHHVRQNHLHQLAHRLFHAVRDVSCNRASFLLRLLNRIVCGCDLRFRQILQRVESKHVVLLIAQQFVEGENPFLQVQELDGKHGAHGLVAHFAIHAEPRPLFVGIVLLHCLAVDACVLVVHQRRVKPRPHRLVHAAE